MTPWLLFAYTLRLTLVRERRGSTPYVPQLLLYCAGWLNPYTRASTLPAGCGRRTTSETRRMQDSQPYSTQPSGYQNRDENKPQRKLLRSARAEGNLPAPCARQASERGLCWIGGSRYFGPQNMSRNQHAHRRMLQKRGRKASLSFDRQATPRPPAGQNIVHQEHLPKKQRRRPTKRWAFFFFLLCRSSTGLAPLPPYRPLIVEPCGRAQRGQRTGWGDGGHTGATRKRKRKRVGLQNLNRGAGGTKRAPRETTLTFKYFHHPEAPLTSECLFLLTA